VEQGLEAGVFIGVSAIPNISRWLQAYDKVKGEAHLRSVSARVASLGVFDVRKGSDLKSVVTEDQLNEIRQMIQCFLPKGAQRIMVIVPPHDPAAHEPSQCLVQTVSNIGHTGHMQHMLSGAAAMFEEDMHDPLFAHPVENSGESFVSLLDLYLRDGSIRTVENVDHCRCEDGILGGYHRDGRPILWVALGRIDWFEVREEGQTPTLALPHIKQWGRG
jgi:hypothetical protein